MARSRDAEEPRRRLTAIVLAGIVGALVLATSIAAGLLWPGPVEAHPGAEAAAGGEIVKARVVAVTELPCMPAGAFDDGSSAEADPDEGGTAAACLHVRAQLPIGEVITFTLDEVRSEVNSIRVGDEVKLLEHRVGADGGGERLYAFYDHPRGGKMLIVAIAFALIVILVGRWRGALALVGVGAAIVLLVTFILPAILAGKPPILVAIVGATGIMILVLYLAHGFSHRTTAALFGSVFGILFTALAGFAVTRWLKFSGVASSEDGSLLMSAPGLQMNDILTATIIIAGLGVLNDITVAQASAVWEMRALNPHLSKRRIYLSAMRVGRDHIASSIYTLVFAYAGAMFVVLLLLYAQPRDLVELVTSEHLGQEIIRTLIGAAGLVLAMPVTTAFAVLFTREATPSSSDQPPVELSHHH